MQYITTTELRTKTSQLVETLKNKGKVSLIHRSQVIGIIQSAPPQPKPFNIEAFKKAAITLNLPKISYAEREKRYRAHLLKKYGKDIPGR